MQISKKDLITVPSDLSLIKMDSDPFYRYKMEALKVWYDKKDTVLSNVIEIANQLHVRPEYILEHFSLKLNTKYEKRIFKKRTEIRLVNFFEQHQLQSQLDNFIVDNLICKRCLVPELRYRRDINSLKADCGTCGYFDVFDPREDKMKEIIYNNPPKRSKKEIEKEEEDDLLYGNREFEYESVESQNEQQQEQDENHVQQEAVPNQTDKLQ